MPFAVNLLVIEETFSLHLCAHGLDCVL